MTLSCNDPSFGLKMAPISIQQVDGVITNAVVSTIGTITIAIPGTGTYHYKMFLSDSATVPDVTLTPPSESSQVEWEGYTDSTGNVTKTIEHSGSHTWYVWASFELMNVSLALTIG